MLPLSRSSLKVRHIAIPLYQMAVNLRLNFEPASNDKMKTALSACSCAHAELSRLPRALWMRLLLPRRRLYVCWQCRRQFLVPVDSVIGVRVVR